jgi:hypothetical protein
MNITETVLERIKQAFSGRPVPPQFRSERGLRWGQCVTVLETDFYEPDIQGAHSLYTAVASGGLLSLPVSPVSERRRA